MECLSVKAVCDINKEDNLKINKVFAYPETIQHLAKKNIREY